MSAQSSMAIPPPCDHDPIRLSHAMVVFGSPGVLPAEFKCSKCEVRWFVDEPTPWPEPVVYTTEQVDGIGTQMGMETS